MVLFRQASAKAKVLRMFVEMEVIALSQLLSRQECLSRFGSDYFIEQRIAAGNLFRLGNGVFAEQKHVPENAIISHRYPHGVITLLSAFYHYSLTDVIPEACDLATSRNAAKIRDARVRQYFVPDEILYQGAIIEQEHDYPIRIYSRERLLIELLRYKSKLPFDLYKEVLLSFRKIITQLNMQDIQDYAMAVPKRKMIMEALQMEVL